jgi:hypothetical protein
MKIPEKTYQSWKIAAYTVQKLMGRNTTAWMRAITARFTWLAPASAVSFA